MKHRKIVLVLCAVSTLFFTNVSYSQEDDHEEYDLLINSLFETQTLEGWDFVNPSNEDYGFSSVQDRCEPSFFNCDRQAYEFHASDSEDVRISQSITVGAGRYKWSIHGARGSWIEITDCISSYERRNSTHYSGICEYDQTTTVTFTVGGYPELYILRLMDADFIQVDFDGNPIADTSQSYGESVNASLRNASCTISSGSVSANLLLNGSFESGDSIPDDWLAQNGLYAPENFGTDGGSDGNNYLYSNNSSAVPQHFIQSIELPESQHLIGGYWKNSHATTTPYLFLGLDTVAMTQTTHINNLWHYGETVANSYGTLNFMVDLPEPNNPLDALDFRFDDAFVVPVDVDPFGTVTVNCAAVEEFYGSSPPETAGTGTGTIQDVDGIPAPFFGAGKVCYSCPYPPGRSDLGIYFAWLACVIRNLFSCDLWYWLKEIENSVLSVHSAVNYQTGWFSSQLQSYANWTAGTTNDGIDFVYAMYQNISLSLNGEGTINNNEASTNLFDVLVALVDLPVVIATAVADSISGLGSLISGSAVLLATIFSIIGNLLTVVSVPFFAIVEMLVVVVDAILLAINAPAITLDEFSTMTGMEATDSDAYSVFVLGNAFVNSFYVDFPWLMWILIINFSYVGWRVSLWLLEQWRGVFSI